MLAFILMFASLASADGVRKRIRFTKGKHSAVVSGSVVRGERDVYTVGAKAGQMMTPKITSPEKNVVFQVEDAGGAFPPDTGEGDDATDWTGDIPSNGDFKITVGGTRGNASYKMSVTTR